MKQIGKTTEGEVIIKITKDELKAVEDILGCAFQIRDYDEETRQKAFKVGFEAYLIRTQSNVPTV